MGNALSLRAAAVLFLACASPVACTMEDGAGPASPDTAGGLTAAQKPNGQFNEKFTFDPVTFSDGTTGIIYAGSRRNKSEYPA